MTSNHDISANDIPDILAGTIGTEQAAYENDPNAVLAALQEDPNLLEEVRQPGFVELVNELAGDAPPTLGTPETVGQAYQDANNESMSDAYNDLVNQQQFDDALNPQPLPPSPAEEIAELREELQELESEIGGAQPTQEFSNFEAPQPEPTFEPMQPEPGFAEDQYGGASGSDLF
jgi:hypothetical protein